jgi:hypothetical protein
MSTKPPFTVTWTMPIEADTAEMAKAFQTLRDPASIATVVEAEHNGRKITVDCVGGVPRSCMSFPACPACFCRG